MSEITIVRGEGEQAQEWWFGDVDDATTRKIFEILGAEFIESPLETA